MKKQFLFIITLAVVATAPVAMAMVKKSSEKEQKRWTLSDWFAQKRQMRAMDLWLGFHKPSPYEFYLGGTFYTGTQDTNYFHRWQAHVAAYAYFLGLEYQRDFLPEESNHGIAHIRLWGIYQQGTNITLHAGAKHQVQTGNTIWNPLAGAAMSLYLHRFLGIEGFARYYFPTTVPALGGKISAVRYEACGFAEFKMIRVFAGYAYEIGQNETLGQHIESGLFGGLRFYF